MERFFTENKDDKQVLSFKKSLPVPEGEKENWYNWCIQHWGTKWDCDIDGKELNDIDHDDDLKWIGYNFSTAWAPPVEWLRFVAKKYPTLNFEMTAEEGGNDYYAKIIAQNDAVYEQTFTAYEYYMENYEEFSDEEDRIKTMPYEEFLKEFSGSLEKLQDEPNGYLHEPAIVARIKDEHLPMFIGVEWNSFEAEEIFTKRMAGVPVTKETT